MKTFVMIIAAIMLSLFVTEALHAVQSMPEPKVEYSADMLLDTGGAVMAGKVYHGTGGKERQEFDSMGGQVIITRQDRNLVWILMPKEKMYMENAFGQGQAKEEAADLRGCSGEMKDTGREVVHGHQSTRYRIAMQCPDTSRYEGTVWVTDDGIMVKMETRIPEKNMTMKLDLKNLKIGKVDPSLFEVPSGYQKFDQDAMMKSYLKQMEAKPEPAKPSPRPKETGRDYTGRDYTAQKRAAQRPQSQEPGTDQSAEEGTELTNKINKIRGILGW